MFIDVETREFVDDADIGGKIELRGLLLDCIGNDSVVTTTVPSRKPGRFLRGGLPGGLDFELSLLISMFIWEFSELLFVTIVPFARKKRRGCSF